MEELLNFVDEKDEVLGTDTKESIKLKKRNYRVSHIWVFSAEELLICRRPAQSLAYADLWTSSAGGHVKAGESYHEAAVREAAEELGIPLQIEHAFTFDYLHPRGGHVFIDLWISRNSEHLAEMCFDAREITEFRFITLAKLLKEMKDEPELFNPQFIQLVERWTENESEKNYRC